MKKDRNSLLLGLAIGLVAIPIVDGVVDLIINSMDIIQCKINQKILKENKITENLQAEQEQVDTYAIGFDLSPDEDDEHYED